MKQLAHAKDTLTAVTAPGAGTVASTMDYYDKWAKQFDQHVVDMGDNIGATTIQRVLEFYPERRDIRILDGGAGTGTVGEMLSRLGFKYFDGIDGSAGMLKEAEKKGVYQRLIHDLHGSNRLDIEDNTYDFFVAVGLFAPGHANEDCIPEIIRVVKPGGKIYFSTREINVINDPHLSVHLEPAMQSHEDNGNWKWLKKEIIPNYLGDWNGFVYTFEVL